MRSSRRSAREKPTLNANVCGGAPSCPAKVMHEGGSTKGRTFQCGWGSLVLEEAASWDVHGCRGGRSAGPQGFRGQAGSLVGGSCSWRPGG